MKTSRMLVASIAALLMLAACSSSDGDGAQGDVDAVKTGVEAAVEGNGPKGMWAGTLPGTDIALAVVANGDQVLAYACDHGKTSEWFAGTASGPNLVLRSRKGAVLNVTLGKTATGTFALANAAPIEFDLPATNSAALYRAEGGNVTDAVLAGWVKLPDGSTRGALEVGKRATGPATVTVAPTLTSPTVQVNAPNLPSIDLGPAAMTPDSLGQPVANVKPSFRWVAMGDSFASGEGNPRTGIADPDEPEDFSGLVWGSDPSMFISFENATNLTRDVTTCHRSDRSGAPQANEQLKAMYPEVAFQFKFTACGGAFTTGLTTDGYLGPDTTDESRFEQDPVPQPAQIDRAKSFAGNQPLDAIYMSTGGNDAGFGPLIEACLSPVSVGLFDCTRDWAGPGGQLSQRTLALRDKYAAVDAKLKATFANGMPNVLISLYPNPIDDGVVNSGLSKPACFGDDYDEHGETGIGDPDQILKTNINEREADFAFGASAVINNQVSLAQTRHGWILVDGHVAPSRGHGYCTDDPWFNLNSAALKKQGRDNPQLVPFSDGLLHPNNKGFTAYANAIVDKMRRIVDTTVGNGLQPPTNVRIAAAENGGVLTVRWNDRATTDNAFEIEVNPVDQQARQNMIIPVNTTPTSDGGFIQRLPGSNLQEYRHDTNRKGLYRYRVRACNTRITTAAPQTTPSCGAFSAPATGANFIPARPTGVAFTSGSVQSGSFSVLTSILNWVAQPEAMEYVVRATPKTGSATPTDTRLAGTSLDLGATLGAKTKNFQVAACNRAGCSIFTTAISP